MVKYRPKTTSKKYRTKRKTKDLDEVYEDLTRTQNKKTLVRREVDPELPGLGNFYCIACARYFCSQTILDEHTKTKGHKRKCDKLTSEAPHGVNLEDVYGMKIDNGPKFNNRRAVIDPNRSEVPSGDNSVVTSVKDGNLFDVDEIKPQY